MAENNLTPLNDNTNPPSDALLPMAMSPHGNGEWDGANLPALASKPAGPDLTVYVHALRRHWLMASGIGLLCAAILGPAVYLGLGDKYTAFSGLRVSMQESNLLPKDQGGLVDRERFEIYKMTQQNLLTSPFVIRAALNKKIDGQDVSKLSCIRDERDQVEWLSKRVSVSFPGKAETMTVSVTRDDPKQAKILVQAVVDAYMSEVVEAEKTKKRDQLSDLQTAFSRQDQELRKKRQNLKNLARDSGSSDSEQLSTQQKLLLEELQSLCNQQDRLQAEIDMVASEMAGKIRARKKIAGSDVVAADLNLLMRDDPMLRDLLMRLNDMQQRQGVGGELKPGKGGGFRGQYDGGMASLQARYDARVAQLRAMIPEKNLQEVEKDIVQLEGRKKVMEAQKVARQKVVDEKKKYAAKIGIVSVEIEMLRADLDSLNKVQATITGEMEKLKVDIDAPARITLYERATEPLGPSNTLVRIALTFFAVLAGLCCPAALVILLDSRAHRINTASDVSCGLQLPVIGSVPLIPAKVIRRLGSPSPRHRAWHLRLTESVDGIAARLLHKADVEQSRVIMVSSATGGEGKTTLATQLALSLARTGRQIVLVDFDLRRPSFDEMFGVPLAPGVSEMLRKEADIDELVHLNVNDNLSVVTAGRWNRQALASLSNGGVSAMFEKLREQFDFIVVDTSPILPIADARFVSKFVDTVVLSVFRDISEAPKIQAACDILSAFGVRSVEAVVTARNADQYGKHTGYESTVSA